MQKKLEWSKTTFKNASGLPNQAQMTTATRLRNTFSCT